MSIGDVTNGGHSVSTTAVSPGSIQLRVRATSAKAASPATVGETPTATTSRSAMWYRHLRGWHRARLLRRCQLHGRYNSTVVDPILEPPRHRWAAGHSGDPIPHAAHGRHRGQGAADSISRLATSARPARVARSRRSLEGAARHGGAARGVAGIRERAARTGPTAADLLRLGDRWMTSSPPNLSSVSSVLSGKRRVQSCQAGRLRTAGRRIR